MPKNSKSKKKTTIKIITVCSALLIIVLVLILVSAVRPQKILSVGTAKAELGPLDDIVSASGILKATNSAVMASQTIGRVKKALVKPGERVVKGQTIILIDDVDARLALSNAEIALEETRRNILNQLAELRASSRRAETSRAQALRSFSNAKELKTVDGISAEAWRQASESAEQAESASVGAKDALRLAQGLSPSEEPVMDSSRDQEFLTRSPTYKRAAINLENARRDLAACTILAEASGTVTEVSVDPGSYVQGGSALAKIEDLSAVTAEVNVDEVDIGKIKVGQSASISADSLFGKELKGRVSAIRPVVKSTGSGRICVVVIDVDLEKEKALSGATCVARVNSRIKDEALVIPASALIPGAAPPAVWLLTDSSGAGKKNSKQAKLAAGLFATHREVKLGASTASKIEIVSGLSAGDLIAVDGIKGLAEGTLVKNRAEEK
jgi:HlyD family secretion protein